MSDRGPGGPSLGKLVAAFAAVYVLWGSTYLGIRFSIETLPPFFTQGVRYAAAGLVLYAWARLSGAPHPTRREWGGGVVTGILLFVCGTGGGRLGGAPDPVGRGRPRRCNRTDRRSC